MVFFVIIIVASGYCILKLLHPIVCFGNFSEAVTAITALFAFIVAINEYYSRKDAMRAKILSEYNKRYSEDSNIVKVVKYLNFIDNDGTINNPNREKPSNYEMEMFMRFYEELDLQIVHGRLDETEVIDLFYYYAERLDKNEELRRSFGITDYNDEHWNSYRRFINRKK